MVDELNSHGRNALAVQWLGLCAFTSPGAQVQFLVEELTSLGKIKKEKRKNVIEHVFLKRTSKIV